MCSLHATLLSSGVRVYRRKVLVTPIEGRLKQVVEQVCQQQQAEIKELEVLPDHGQRYGKHGLRIRHVSARQTRSADVPLVCFGKRSQGCNGHCPRSGPLAML